MDPITAAVILGGTALTTGLGVWSSNRQMKFQREMSGTSYQRAMADMRKAGLNPMLAYSQGGASTPQGAGFQAGDFSQVAVAANAKELQKAQIAGHKQAVATAKEQAKVYTQTANITKWKAKKEKVIGKGFEQFDKKVLSPLINKAKGLSLSDAVKLARDFYFGSTNAKTEAKKPSIIAKPTKWDIEDAKRKAQQNPAYMRKYWKKKRGEKH